MPGCSPLLGDLLNSKWADYQKHLTDVKIKRTVVTCCLCQADSRLDTDERRSLKSFICPCTHPLCANCAIRSEVFAQLHGFRHTIAASDRSRYSYGFYCDRCGASNKVPPVLQPRAVDTARRLRGRPPSKDWVVDFTWRKCRWCEQRCHEKCLLYYIKPWEHASDVASNPRRSRKDYDYHANRIQARTASGYPTSPLALHASVLDEAVGSDNAAFPNMDIQTTSCNHSMQEPKMLRYAT